jgi:parvulin-like peptidyl-prolyl isomerase
VLVRLSLLCLSVCLSPSIHFEFVLVEIFLFISTGMMAPSAAAVSASGPLNAGASSFVPSSAASDVRARLRLVLLHLGEKSQASLETNMSKLAQLLEKDLERHGEFVVDTIFQWYFSMIC